MTFNKYNFILLAGGKGTRFSKNVNKTTLDFRNAPLIEHILHQLEKIGISNITIVYNSDNKKYFHKYSNLYKLIKGGKERSDSIKNAIFKDSTGSKFTIIHDLARPFIDKDTIFSLKKTWSLATTVLFLIQM